MRAWTLSTVRGTVQADILKEDQGQNTCTVFSLKVAGDIQEWLVHRNVRNVHLVTIAGYHIADVRARRIPGTRPCPESTAASSSPETSDR